MSITVDTSTEQPKILKALRGVKPPKATAAFPPSPFAGGEVLEFSSKLKSMLMFDRFSVALSPVMQERLPKVEHLCCVRPNQSKSGSAYSSMIEYAAVAGYIESALGLKALVVFVERLDYEDQSQIWAFVPVESLVPYKELRKKQFSLTWA